MLITSQVQENMEFNDDAEVFGENHRANYGSMC